MLRRPRLVMLAAVALTFSILLPGTAVAVTPPSLVGRVVQNGLVIPWDIAFAPGGQMIVTERPGRVRVYESGNINAPLLATSTISRVRAEGEAGVMGIAIDNEFATTRWVFICVSRDDNGGWRNQLIRYRMTADWHLDFSKYLIRNGMRANTIHNGCAVQQGPGGRIWLSMGDGGNGMDAQDPNKLNGKILRIERDGSIPSTNPIWPGHSSPTRVYSIGHRNPQGIAFHPENGRVYAVEHGPDVDDEINWIRPGRNYGWPCVTGSNNFNASCPGHGAFTAPAFSTEGPTWATSGGAFVNGANWGDWDNSLLVCSLKESDLRRFSVALDGSPVTFHALVFNNTWGRLRAAVLGPGNKLYITTSNGSNDKVIRITPSP
ncbi:MAG TPA: PQQ-dependent sugar dehydrogenase [Candidatus Limnocylindria bacterium]